MSGRKFLVKTLCTTFLFLIVCFNVFTALKGKYAGEFIAIGVGGRALGLGGAYTALASDITAGYWNLSGLSAVMYPQVSLMHDERFAGLVNYDYGAVAVPVGLLSSLALSVIHLGIDDIPNTQRAGVDANGNHEGSYVLSIKDGLVRQVWNDQRPYGLDAIWFVPSRRYVVVGFGVWTTREPERNWTLENSLPMLHSTCIDGQGLNDFVVGGAFWLLAPNRTYIVPQSGIPKSGNPPPFLSSPYF
jgi:hypothetical protein